MLFPWSDFDFGAENAQAALFIDGKPPGAIVGQIISMDGDIGRTEMYVTVNSIGLLDDLGHLRSPAARGRNRAAGGRPRRAGWPSLAE